MFRNYLKTSLRSIWRNALFSTINVVGLAIAMSVGILMILFLSEIYSFDRFHEKEANIYRITSQDKFMGQENHWATSSIYIADQVREQVPAIEDLVIMRMGLSADVKAQNDFVNITGFYSTSSFFDLFSFQLLQGDAETALDEPNSIVLTASTAQKLFGGEEALGQTLEFESTGGWQQRQIAGVVTGILADLPVYSHLQFEVLVSLSTYDQPAAGAGWRSDFRTNPGDFQTNYVYLQLRENTSPEEVESHMEEILTEHNAALEDPIIHGLQPLSDCATNDMYLNLPGPSFSQRKINVMILLTVIVLLSACFNYTNLSLARALRRTKEVGIRKVTGATRSQIFTQFVSEAVVLSLFAMITGLGLFILLKPGFLALPNPSARGHAMFLLDVNAWHLLSFLIFALVIGCIAGLAPAFFLSKLKVLNALQQANRTNAFSAMNVRKALTAFQIILSVGLIMSSALIYDQYEYAMNYELGYQTENVINVQIQGDYAPLLENEFATVPDVVETSRSERIMGWSAVFSTAQSEDKSTTLRFLINEIDHKYLEMYGFEFVAGSNFRKLAGTEEDRQQIIVNEEFVRALGLTSPEEALGTHVWFNDNQMNIIGVVRDFITTSLVWDVDKKFGFIQAPLEDRGILGVKLGGDDQLSTLLRLEAIFEEIDPLHPFEADFYDDQIAFSYREYKSMYTIISFLAFLAISISTLGLLGMAVFSVETRMKEISIRKVLGAGMRSLTLLLSRSYLVMVVAGSLVAIPITLYLVDRMLLADFLYRSDFKVIDVLSGSIVVFVVALLTTSWQVSAAAAKNPAETLRNE